MQAPEGSRSAPEGIERSNLGGPPVPDGRTSRTLRSKDCQSGAWAIWASAGHCAGSAGTSPGGLGECAGGKADDAGTYLETILATPGRPGCGPDKTGSAPEASPVTPGTCRRWARPHRECTGGEGGESLPARPGDLAMRSGAPFMGAPQPCRRSRSATWITCPSIRPPVGPPRHPPALHPALPGPSRRAIRPTPYVPAHRRAPPARYPALAGPPRQAFRPSRPTPAVHPALPVISGTLSGHPRTPLSRRRGRSCVGQLRRPIGGRVGLSSGRS
jgi:hypothetical protein